jgi:hypothetical protein
VKFLGTPSTGPDITIEFTISAEGEATMEVEIRESLTPTAIRLAILQLNRIADELEAGIKPNPNVSASPFDRSLS